MKCQMIRENAGCVYGLSLTGSLCCRRQRHREPGTPGIAGNNSGSVGAAAASCVDATAGTAVDRRNL